MAEALKSFIAGGVGGVCCVVVGHPLDTVRLLLTLSVSTLGMLTLVVNEDQSAPTDF